MCSTVKIMSLVFESCPRLAVHEAAKSERVVGRPRREVTSQGPVGLKPGAILPLGPLTAGDRHLEVALGDIVRGDEAGDVLRATPRDCRDRRCGVPMTMPSSTSQSVFSLPRGIVTVSFGPTTVFGVLRKRIGMVGGSEPDSAAWGRVVHADADHGARAGDRGADAHRRGVRELGELSAFTRGRDPGDEVALEEIAVHVGCSERRSRYRSPSTRTGDLIPGGAEPRELHVSPDRSGAAMRRPVSLTV